MPQNLFRIGLFEPALYFLHPDQDTKPLLRERMIAGSFSGAMGSLLCNPLDLIKTRIQVCALLGMGRPYAASIVR
jgi:solute carrier family 25 protein 34/35